MTRRLVMLALAAALAGCGNANVVTPRDVAQNYAFQLAEGNFPQACALFDPAALRSLASGSGGGCRSLLARCLPKSTTSLRRDETQLFYVNTDLQESGSRATVTVSGTAVARSVRRVSLADERGRWRLTSPGRGIDRCLRARGRRGRRARG